MLARLALLALAATTLRGCISYEYEHEIWLKVDGSGTIDVSGQPRLWTAFKGVPLDEADPQAMRRAARELFERSGLRVRRTYVTRRRGRNYLFLSADFKDVNRISYTEALPDLRVGLRREGGRLHLDGSWQRPLSAARLKLDGPDGLVTVRFHLPSKVYSHRNAADGLERGNILGWRQPLASALDGSRLELGAEMDERSILFSTVLLFAGAVVLAVVLLATALWAVVRRGRRDLAQSVPGGPGV